MRFHIVALATVAIVVAVAVSCDRVPLTSPTGSTISLSVDRSIVPVNGQATITAVVTESAGTAVHNGTTVSFQTTMGTLSPSEAQTVNGRAVVTYVAPSTSGVATINAYSGGATTSGSGNSSAGGVQVRVGSAAVGSLSVNAVPSSVPPTGGAVTVSARVLDSANNPLPSVAVIFSADSGTLSSTSAVTNAEGVATVSLSATRATKVTATVGDKSNSFDIGVLSTPSVTVALGSGAGTPTVGVPVPFTVTLGSPTNSSPIQVVAVDFGDGQSQTFSSPTGSIGLTHTYSTHGGYTVTATATDINGQRGVSSLPVVIAPVALPTVSLSAAPNPILVTGNGFTTFTVTATAGSSPIRSVVVRLANGTTIYTGTGGGSFTYQFGTFPGGATYTVTASVTDALGNVGTTSIVVVLNGS